MSKNLLYSMVFLAGVLISSVAQIMLKKSSQIKYNNTIKEYLNLKVIVAYSIFFGATFCSVFAYKYVPLSMGPILSSTEYIFVAILSLVFLSEKLSKRKILGLSVIVVGVLIAAFN